MVRYHQNLVYYLPYFITRAVIFNDYSTEIYKTYVLYVFACFDNSFVSCEACYRNILTEHFSF